MSLIFNNKRIGFNGKRLTASKTGEVIIGPDEPPVEEEYCPNCGEVWDGEYCGNCGYPDVIIDDGIMRCPLCGEEWDGMYCGNCGYEEGGDDPGDPGDDPGGMEIG